MKVNGFGYPPRGEAFRVACPYCTASLEFGRRESTTVRIGRPAIRSLRCARCRTRIDLGTHQPEPIGPGTT